MTIAIKRVYETPSEDDGYRVLVDRLWPRGLAKAKVDFWAKEIAPSKEVRQRFNHEVSRWQEFRQEYQAELEQAKTSGSKDLQELLKIIQEKPIVTLLYGAKDIEHNNAVVLQDFLQQM